MLTFYVYRPPRSGPSPPSSHPAGGTQLRSINIKNPRDDRYNFSPICVHFVADRQKKLGMISACMFRVRNVFPKCQNAQGPTLLPSSACSPEARRLRPSPHCDDDVIGCWCGAAHLRRFMRCPQPQSGHWRGCQVIRCWRTPHSRPQANCIRPRGIRWCEKRLYIGSACMFCFNSVGASIGSTS